MSPRSSRSGRRTGARRWLAGVLVAALAAGCTSTAPGASQAPTAAPATAAPATAAPATAAPATAQNFAGITLNVLTNDYHKDWEFTVPEITAAFEKATGAKINVTYIPSDQRTTKFASIVATKDPTYDLIVATVLEAESYANIMYENLEGKLQATTLPDMTTYTKAANAGAYALPNLDGVAITYWNTERWAAAGLDPAKGPNTWEELWAACEKINAKFPGQFCLDLPFPNSQISFAYWSMLLNASCGEMYSPDLKATAFNSPQGLAALEVMKKWASFADRGSFSLPGSYEASKRLAQGNLTTVSFGFSNEYKQFLTDPATSKIIGKIGFGLIPGIGGCKTGSYNGWEGYGINVYGDPAKKAAAYAYLDWLVSVPVQTEMSRNFGFLPVRKSLLAAAPADVAIPTWATAGEQYAGGKVSRHGSAFFFQVAELWDKTLRDVIDNKIQPQAALDQLETQTQTIIDQYYAR